jgi:hypothetical protein
MLPIPEVKMELITGWLVLDGKAVFVKCRSLNESRTVVQVSVPRKYKFTYRTKRALSKNRAACLRRHIKTLKQESVRLNEALKEAQRRVNQINYLACSLKEQLKRA